MQQYITNYNYINDYYKTVYDFYSTHYPKYPVTYYNIDWDASIYDEKMMAASYEKWGIGELSGMKWNKIQMLPVYGVDTVQPSFNADESGYTLRDSEMSGMAIPTTYNIQPYPWDVVRFDQSFMMKGLETTPTFVVTNVELATFGEITHYRLRLQVIGGQNIAEDLEKQLEDRFSFVETTRSIHRVDAAYVLFGLESKNNDVVNIVNNKMSNTGFYLEN